MSEKKPAPKLIMLTLRGNQNISFKDVIDRLKRRGSWDDAAVKAALWQLIAEQKIVLTRDRKLRTLAN